MVTGHESKVGSRLLTAVELETREALSCQTMDIILLISALVEDTIHYEKAYLFRAG